MAVSGTLTACVVAWKLEGWWLFSCSAVFDSATAWTVARQAPLSMGFSRQEYWSGLLLPPPGDLPDPGVESVSPTAPASASRFFTTEPAVRAGSWGSTALFSSLASVWRFSECGATCEYYFKN